MKAFISFLRTNLLIGCLAWFVVSCSTSVSTTPFSQSATPIVPATSVVSDLQPTYAPLTATILPTSTPTPITISTPLPQEAPTVLPTLSSDEAKTFVLELTQNNGDCLLPCFWGFMPGKTDWQTAEPLLATFAYQIHYGSSDGTFSDTPDGDSFTAWVYLYFPEISPVPISYVFTVQDGIITMIEAHILPTPSYALPTILDTYGQPDEVWLLTAKAPREGFLGFTLTLFYGQQGFMMTYGSQGAIEEGKVKSCLPATTFDEMVLATWSPLEEMTYEEAVNRTTSFGTTEYERSLEEAAGMSVATFYEIFKDTEESVCLETPTELWPGP
ncbi:MAG: hypothetical protein KJ069_24960 [Anaerolineae bacterium]|nr:hypothetical protein [Anaerolineae bacterium]